jgi:23S rRNA (uracil1939-C5)-methyltransferase
VSRRRKNKKDLPVFERVQIYDAGAEGKAIARVDNMVIFVPFGAPGDIVDIKVIGKRKSFYEGEIIGFHHYSDVRRSPKCEHFGLCGGCKWQHIEYGKQLYFKQKQVVDSFERIGKIKIPAFQSIIPSESEYFYRNKLEFSFSNRKWLTDISSENINDTTTNGLGMHLPRMFDRIVDLENCYLQKEPSNSIRLFLRDYGIKRNLTFYDSRNHHGFLRNVTIRTASTGQTMVIISFGYDDNNEIAELVNQWGLVKKTAVYIGGVDNKSGVENSALQKGDILIQLNDQVVGSIDDLHKLLTEKCINKELNLKIIRKGKLLELKVTAGELS